MARVLPLLSEAQRRALKSKAEARFYEACGLQLPADWLVLFSTPWVGATASGRRYDGEADFLIFAPNLGLLVVEIKGGGVSYVPQQGCWFSIDGAGHRHEIKDPFRQAVAEKHAILAILRSDPRWRKGHPGFLLAGHAVLLADVDRVEAAVSPQSPREILGGKADLTDLATWVQRVLAFWGGSAGDWRPLDVAGLAAAEAILSGRIEVRPLMATHLAAEEEIRVQLTEQQSRVLRGLGGRARAAICGGAGTGKTLLALEKARQLSVGGKRTLLLCYNRLLADYFKTSSVANTNLFPMSFHQLCDWRIRGARVQSGRDVLAEAKQAYTRGGSQNLYDVQMPYALALSCEVLKDRFDAIIVDEGQDFRQEYWLPVEWLLVEENKSLLYIFYDQNQALYTRAPSFPIKDEPFVLTFNCRNTRFIHECAYRFYRGDATDPPPGNEGVPINTITVSSLQTQAEQIHSGIVALLTREGLRADQIAVLVCGQPKEAFFSALMSKPLPNSTRWTVEGPAASAGLRLDTVRRYKGLEADVVYLWGLDTLASTEQREQLYVGISRAKSRLTLVGGSSACDSVLSAHSSAGI